MVEDKAIEEAVNYIFNDDKEVPATTTRLKIKVVEGNNGTYYLEDNGIRLERKNAYVLFETKQELDAWTAEFSEVFKLTT